VIAGFLVCAFFASSPALSPPSEAMARTDSILHVRAIAHDRVAAPPSVARPDAIEADAPHGVVIAKPRPAHRMLLALAH
jgi:hypothetical protein